MILNAANVAVNVLLCLDLGRLSSYIVISSSNQINFGLSLDFYREGHRLVEKLLLILFFVRNSTNISSSGKPLHKEEFFTALLIEIAIILFV